ncbi:hypothetical protein C8C77_13918 [Halanaerobium saccharolyticum]|uniref:Uncharacterized protein n=1 Tax=Halanaerobium saccharolyticum TaxID=43595 RepID=A0A4R7YMK4_9FIRM|nr:hypothetical protein [Halanaerobium saccharolyticum]RAK04160.1 hypothetical protein C7958_13618 [Halanaerobium saccharolyticum]TDV97955.1 hypothetical protein C8C77_13918 [Halanaerobium saccharolyticum]TDX51016.1 hypothetical protein C7956_13918 [Halanaerobium saccharolyticum]
MKGYSKKTKKEIRRLAGLAHERELEIALADLNLKFKQWENEELGPFELDEQIHKFHNKISREIFKKYNSYNMEDHFVAIAIVNGIINKDEVDLEAYQELELLIERIKDSDYFTNG